MSARIYLAAGFALTGTKAHHSFGVDLVGQTYQLDLTGDIPARTEAMDGP